MKRIDRKRCLLQKVTYNLQELLGVLVSISEWVENKKINRYTEKDCEGDCLFKKKVSAFQYKFKIETHLTILKSNGYFVFNKWI